MNVYVRRENVALEINPYSKMRLFINKVNNSEMSKSWEKSKLKGDGHSLEAISTPWNTR